MIDLDKIESAARKPWYCRSKQEDNLLSPEVLVDLITRLRQAEKDAARYRWLDEQNKSVMSKVMVCNGWIDDGDDVEYVSDIASFIDEAMQCK